MLVYNFYGVLRDLGRLKQVIWHKALTYIFQYLVSSAKSVSIEQVG